MRKEMIGLPPVRGELRQLRGACPGSLPSFRQRRAPGSPPSPCRELPPKWGEPANLRALVVGLLLLALPACAGLPGPREETWVGAWASSQQVPEPNNALPTEALDDATLRQTVHLARGGEKLRVKLSNAFGTEPLEVASASVARAEAPGSPRIKPGTATRLTFDEQESVTIPAGEERRSDPVEMDVAAFEDLAVSVHLPAPPETQTSHPGSRTTSHTAQGDHVLASDLPDAQAVDHWYQLSGVEVAAERGAEALVVLGDSITDGRGSTTNANNRWPDLLARRLLSDPATAHVSVLNAGIGGNRLLADGLGPSALSRLDRDVLSQPHVRHLIVLEGVNDLGVASRDGPEAVAAITDRIIAAYEEIIDRAHARGIAVYGATIMPYAGSGAYVATPDTEYARWTINHWIRTSGRFDAVIDFDRALRDPQNPIRLRAAYDSGDRLHPSPAGFRAMAETVPRELFVREGPVTSRPAQPRPTACNRGGRPRPRRCG